MQLDHAGDLGKPFEYDRRVGAVFGGFHHIERVRAMRGFELRDDGFGEAHCLAIRDADPDSTLE